MSTLLERIYQEIIYYEEDAVRMENKIAEEIDALTASYHNDFTIEDIHKIRGHNYERTKDMTIKEKVLYYNNSGREAEQEIERRRALKRKAVANI